MSISLGKYESIGGRRMQQINFTLEKQKHTTLKIRAATANLNVTEILRKLVDMYLKGKVSLEEE